MDDLFSTAATAEDMDWSDLRVFLAIHRSGSFAGAARALKVNATTAARRLAALEEAVQAQLFARTADGLVPTAAAEEIIEAVQVIERQTERIERTVGGEDARLAGVVRLAVTQAFATGFLLDHLGAFHRMHPEIELELNTSDAMVDLSRGGADVAVRFRGAGTGPGVTGAGPVEIVAKRITSIGIGVFGSRGYFERAGYPQNAHDVAGHDVIVPRESATYLPGFEWAREIEPTVRIALRSDGVASIGAAAAAGFGLCAIPSFVALHQPNLLRVLEPAIVDSRDVWLLMPAELRRVARIRAVWDFMVELCKAWGPILSGEVVAEGRIAIAAESADN